MGSTSGKPSEEDRKAPGRIFTSTEVAALPPSELHPTLPSERLVGLSTASPRGLYEHVLRNGALAGTPLCVVVTPPTFSAVFDLCSHKQARLHLGDIEDSLPGVGACVKCPRHKKKYPGGLNVSLESGAWVAGGEGRCYTQAECGDVIPKEKTGVFSVVADDAGGLWVSTEPVAGKVKARRPD